MKGPSQGSEGRSCRGASRRLAPHTGDFGASRRRRLSLFRQPAPARSPAGVEANVSAWEIELCSRSTRTVRGVRRDRRDVRRRRRGHQGVRQADRRQSACEPLRPRFAGANSHLAYFQIRLRIELVEDFPADAAPSAIRKDQLSTVGRRRASISSTPGTELRRRSQSEPARAY